VAVVAPLTEDSGGLFFLDDRDAAVIEARESAPNSWDVPTALFDVLSESDEPDRSEPVLGTDVAVRSVTLAQASRQTPRVRRRQRLSDALSRARAAWRGFVTTLRDSWAWLTAETLTEVRRRRHVGRHRLAPTGLHRTTRTVLGRERSSAEFAHAAALRAREPRDEEGDLVFRDGDTFVSWVALALESARRLGEARHPPAPSHRFLCS
jgi:hypothetical protein